MQQCNGRWRRRVEGLFWRYSAAPFYWHSRRCLSDTELRHGLALTCVCECEQKATAESIGLRLNAVICAKDNEAP